jgi:hypothetical protein
MAKTVSISCALPAAGLSAIPSVTAARTGHLGILILPEFLVR